MLCPTCGQTVKEGSRFCMHCGSPVTVTGTEDKTVTEDLEATVLESSGDLYETTVMISPGSFPSTSEKPICSKSQTPTPIEQSEGVQPSPWP